jgi:hypothetical protein
MIWSLFAEAVVSAKRMIRALFAEAIVIIVVAKPMIWTPVAQTRQGHQFNAKTMFRMPATETTQVNVPKQRFGLAATSFGEQHPACDGRGGRYDDPGVRGGRGESECAEYDAVQQHAVCRSKRSHGSPPG